MRLKVKGNLFKPDNDYHGEHVAAYGGYRFFITKRGKFKAKTVEEARNSYGIWNFESERGFIQLYATCPSCGVPANISDWSISKDGRVYELCVVCEACEAHFFPKLTGWKPEYRQRIFGKAPKPRKKR